MSTLLEACKQLQSPCCMHLFGNAGLLPESIRLSYQRSGFCQADVGTMVFNELVKHAGHHILFAHIFSSSQHTLPSHSYGVTGPHFLDPSRRQVIAPHQNPDKLSTIMKLCYIGSVIVLDEKQTLTSFDGKLKFLLLPVSSSRPGVAGHFHPHTFKAKSNDI